MRKKLDHMIVSTSDVYPDSNWEHIDFGAGFPPFMRGVTVCTFFDSDLSLSEKNIVAIDSQENVIETYYSLLSKGKEYIENELAKGNLIDSIVSNLFFSLKCSKNNVLEIACQRASRMVWSKIIYRYFVKNQQSMALNLIFTSENDNSKYKSTTTIDPWGGSFYIEKLTHEISRQFIEKLQLVD